MSTRQMTANSAAALPDELHDAIRLLAAGAIDEVKLVRRTGAPLAAGAAGSAGVRTVPVSLDTLRALSGEPRSASYPSAIPEPALVAGERPGPMSAFLDGLAKHRAQQTTLAQSLPSELTTAQMAQLVNVSRTFIVKEIDQGRLPARKVGTKRRIAHADAIAYQQRMAQQRTDALAELATTSRDLGLYDE
jgi:excisionase family DNA binding protein